MRNILAFLGVVALSFGSCAVAADVWNPATRTYDGSKCSSEGFQAYDYDYRYAYSQIVCATEVDPVKGSYFLARRDLRGNHSELIGIGTAGKAFQILGIDRGSHLYWMASDMFLSGPTTELVVKRTNLTSLTTDTLRLKLARPAVEVANRGYYNGGYVIQVVDQDRKRTLYGLGGDGDIVPIYDEATAECAYECGLFVPNTFYSPLVFYSYAVDSGGGSPYYLKGIDVLDGRTRSVLLSAAQITPYDIIMDGVNVDISLSQAGDRFVMSEGAIGRKAYEAWFAHKGRDFIDTSLDAVIVYDRNRPGNPFFTVAQPFYGVTAVSPDGQLFYRQLPNSVTVRRIDDRKEIWTGVSLTSDVKFLDNQTLLLNHSSHTTFVPLEQ